MKRLTHVLICALIAFTFSGCLRFSKLPSADSVLWDLEAEFLAGHLAWRPALGTTLGLHQFDGRVTDYSRASLDAEIKRLHHFDAQFAAIRIDDLGRDAAFDLRLLQTIIRGELFGFEKLKAYSRNPMTYAQAVDLTQYVKRDFAPLPERLRSIIAIEMQMPALLTAARANLDATLPKPLVETAIQIAEGNVSFLEKDMPLAVQAVTAADLQRDFSAANAVAIQELRAYAQWLKEQRLPTADENFALGPERYREMLRVTELVEIAPEAILALGEKELKAEQERFVAAARQIDPSRPPAETFRSLQKEHPTAENLLEDTRKNLASIRDFVTSHDLVTIPSPVPVRVEETPPPFRRTSFASMDAPGVFEKSATEAYYYVTLPEKDWPEKQKEEWMTAFNFYTTDIVSVHEAYPGHYVQFLALKNSGASRVAKIASSYAFVEGWAHYTEQMMVDEGFPNRGATTQEKIVAAKYRLAQSSEALLRLCRLCASIKLHTQGMSVDEATRFFMDNAYYEEKPAHQEAVRGTFDPGYLNYTLGKMMLLKLRQDWQQQEGAAFSMRRFHDAILRSGAPPIPLLRERLLKNPKAWPALLNTNN